jgi:hypothetical protein
MMSGWVGVWCGLPAVKHAFLSHHKTHNQPNRAKDAPDGEGRVEQQVALVLQVQRVQVEGPRQRVREPDRRVVPRENAHLPPAGPVVVVVVVVFDGLVRGLKSGIISAPSSPPCRREWGGIQTKPDTHASTHAGTHVRTA